MPRSHCPLGAPQPRAMMDEAVRVHIPAVMMPCLRSMNRLQSVVGNLFGLVKRVSSLHGLC